MRAGHGNVSSQTSGCLAMILPKYGRAKRHLLNSHPALSTCATTILDAHDLASSTFSLFALCISIA